MACGTRVVSSSPCFSEAVSYALQKLQMSHMSLKEEQRLFMKAIFDEQDVFVWLPTGQETVSATKLDAIVVSTMEQAVYERA